MAIRRTRQQREEAELRRVQIMNKPEDNKLKLKSSQAVGSLSFSGDQIHLIKRDLLKTLIISVFIFILLFGIYIYMR